MSDQALACPRCATSYPPEERFCAECGMPLVHAGGGEQAPITDAHRRARKIRPQYTRGELTRVATGRNQAEGELIQGMLLEEGIPSILRRTRGFDVPDFLAAGPRDVMVPQAAVEAAREMLEAVEGPPPTDRTAAVSPLKLMAGILIVLAIGFGIALLLFEGAA